MNIPFVNYIGQYWTIRGEIHKVIDDCLSQGDLIDRQQLKDFETHIAEFLGVKYAVGVKSCTDAMYFSLLACGIKPLDEVITVSHTFIASISAIARAGATPVLVDIGDDYNINPDLIEPAITEKTKAILVVHLNGRCCDMAKIIDIAGKYNLFVIEDCAQSIGAEFEFKKAGSFGDAGCFSFYPAKVLGGYGDGGLVSTDKESIARKVRLYRDHCMPSKSEILGWGYESILDNVQASLLDMKLRHLPKHIEQRREIAFRYNGGLISLKEVIRPTFITENNYFDVYQNYVIRAKERDNLKAHITSFGIETMISPPVPNHKQQALGLEFNLPKTEQFTTEFLSLPMYPELTMEQVDYVCQAICDFYRR